MTKVAHVTLATAYVTMAITCDLFYLRSLLYKVIDSSYTVNTVNTIQWPGLTKLHRTKKVINCMIVAQY